MCVVHMTYRITIWASDNINLDHFSGFSLYYYEMKIEKGKTNETYDVI